MLPSDGRTSTVPPWSTGAVPSFMPPTPTFPSYWPTATNPPPLFGASASEAVETNPDVFTSEDRLALRLIFHQQQAIQAQQNAIISWLQQITTLLSHMDRPGRPSTDFTAATTTMPPPARRASGVHADAVPPVERKAETTTANLSSTAGDDPRRSSSRGEDAHRRLEAHLKLETPNVGGSRSCTPPGDDGAASHNRSIDSIAAPWDPNNRLGSSFRSVRSSHGGSQLGRLENPLLSSSQASLLRQRATRGADVTSARMLSRPGSANTTQLQEQTGISGFAQSGSLLSTSLQRSGDSLSQRPHPVVAPPRRGGVGSAFHSSSAGGDQESERPVPPYRRAPEPGAPQTADPAPISPNPTRVMAVAEASPASIRSMGFYSAHGEESRAEDESRDLRAAQPAKRAALGQPTGISDDSLSDGCGSYETRKYLKEIGLF